MGGGDEKVQYLLLYCSYIGIRVLQRQEKCTTTTERYRGILKYLCLFVLGIAPLVDIAL